MKSVRIFFLTISILTLSNYVHAAPNGDVTVNQLLEQVGGTLNTQVTDILTQQVPRLGYTGLAFTAGTAGIFTAYKGFARFFKGVDEGKKKTIITGGAQFTLGLSTTAASIAIIRYLWNR